MFVHQTPIDELLSETCKSSFRVNSSMKDQVLKASHFALGMSPSIAGEINTLENTSSLLLPHCNHSIQGSMKSS